MAQIHAQGQDCRRSHERGRYLFKKNKITWIKGTARLTRARRRRSKATRRRARPKGDHRRDGVAPERARASDRSPAHHHQRRSGSLERGAESDRHHGRRRRRRRVRLHLSTVGSEVTILELLRLVPVEDEAVSAELEKSFRKQGITCRTGARVTGAKASGDGVDIDAQLADGTSQRIRADYLLWRPAADP
jgi:dihydrolipoamide dehydrogenase